MSPLYSFLQTLFSLLLALISVFSSYWCVGVQKVPKPLCSLSRTKRCIQTQTPADGSFSWETGDDRFIFPEFHAGLWICCIEDTRSDSYGMVWLYVLMELLYISLLSISSLLLLLQVCLSRCSLGSARCGGLLNAFAAICTVLGGLVGMVAHMMFMQVFQVTISLGPEDFKPHSFSYSVAWLAFSCCMCSGVSTLNNYTRQFLMGSKGRSVFYPCPRFTFPPQISPLSPYYCPPADLSHSTPGSSPSSSVDNFSSDDPPPLSAGPSTVENGRSLLSVYSSTLSLDSSCIYSGRGVIPPCATPSPSGFSQLPSCQTLESDLIGQSPTHRLPDSSPISTPRTLFSADSSLLLSANPSCCAGLTDPQSWPRLLSVESSCFSADEPSARADPDDLFYSSSSPHASPEEELSSL
ncbi:hypothetical protein DNTS_009466 [Danionella cerebrum]|uniref:Germ cell-specific gene 1-like protein n=1 Tax=Danionella cerebrum TaxID=2873325 RepID=A0A553PWV0_9TELE|nr:hypothetical protein DNTS_009466 [Danionella translucida]